MVEKNKLLFEKSKFHEIKNVCITILENVPNGEQEYRIYFLIAHIHFAYFVLEFKYVSGRNKNLYIYTS